MASEIPQWVIFLPDEVGHPLGHLLRGHRRVDAVLIVEVDGSVPSRRRDPSTDRRKASFTVSPASVGRLQWENPMHPRPTADTDRFCA